MGKKKKKKQEEVIAVSFDEFDENLDETYNELVTEIKRLKMKLAIIDSKSRKRIKKGKKKKKANVNGNSFNNEAFRVYMRKQVVKDMESTDLMGRVEKFLQQVIPVVKIVARLFASLIVAILSIDCVKIHIKPETLDKMTSMYQFAMSVA